MPKKRKVIKMTISVKDFSTRVRLGEPQRSGSLTLYPLFATAANAAEAGHDKPAYLLLGEALDTGKFEIGEVSESGSVNTVIITNMTGLPVLILDGEEIVGAKQNRMVNATILVAAGSKTAVPVSCVERGRWHYESNKFEHSETFGYSSLRRQKAEQVQYSLHRDQSFAADQAAIWDEIDTCHLNLKTEAPTGALRDSYHSRADELNKMIEGLKHQPGQLGVMVYIKNRFACLDLFDQSETLAKLWSRLLKSYAIEALSARQRARKEPHPTPASVIGVIDKSEYMTYPSVSLGLDLRLNGPGIIGAGLLVDEKIVHLSVFPREENAADIGDINTPLRRRRNIS
jgi:hypothetical protein